nr:WG repeat-containing protein [Neobacillus sp. Marseille-Q6967]
MEQNLDVNDLFPASYKTLNGIKWGFINNRGQFVIYPQYEDVSEFQMNGLAIVWLQGHVGIIDQHGRFVVPPIYNSIYPFSEGHSIVYEEDKGYKVIDETGKILTGQTYSFTYFGDFHEHRLVFQDFVNRKEFLYGYLDSNGEIVIPAQFKYAHDFQDGQAIVGLKDGTSALIGLNGERLRIYPYEQMGDLSEGLISFRKTDQDKSGYVNEEGKVVIPPGYSSAMPFENGRAIVNTSENYKNQYGLIDKTGAFIIPPKYDDINLIGENRASVAKAIDPEYPHTGSVFAIADTTTGNFLTDFIYDSVSDYQGEYGSVTKDVKTFFINKKGTRAQNLPIFNGTGSVSLKGDLIQAIVDERYSYYDLNGNLVWTQNMIFPLTGPIHIREEKYRPNKNYLVYYPKIQGMENKLAQSKVNQYLRNKSRVKDLPKDGPLYSSYSGNFSVQFFQKHLLVLELTGYEYPFGAAHGMPSKINVHINLITGQIYQLKDLFTTGSHYKQVLSEIIGKEIHQHQDSFINEDQYIGIKENHPFFLTKDHLVIYFKPYEIASFAFGFPEFGIPYQDIQHLINEKGAFWQSFH